MKITGIEAIVLVWPPPEKDFWTALRTIGRVNDLVVRIHTDEGIAGIGEAHGQGAPFPCLYSQDWEELFTVRPEIKNGELTLLDRPGWGVELDERTLNERGVWA